MDPLSIARYGMMSAQDRLAKSASRVANWQGGDEPDLAQETVGLLKPAGPLIRANTRVIAKKQGVRIGHVWRCWHAFVTKDIWRRTYRGSRLNAEQGGGSGPAE